MKTKRKEEIEIKYLFAEGAAIAVPDSSISFFAMGFEGTRTPR